MIIGDLGRFVVVKQALKTNFSTEEFGMNYQSISAKWFAVLGLALSVSSVTAMAHDPDERVSLEPTVQGAVTAGAFNYVFQMIDTKKNMLVADKDLLVMSEKKLHFFIYDTALKNLQHVHPEYKDGKWQVAVNLPQDGKYWVWAQGQLAVDKAEFSASNRLLIKGGTPADLSKPDLKEKRSAMDGNSVATLSNDVIHAGKAAMLMVTYSRKDGTAPQITPFLGSLGHATVVSSDEDALYHVHPMQHANMLMLHMELKEVGDYRVWLQFMDGGQLKTVALAVPVIK